MSFSNISIKDEFALQGAVLDKLSARAERQGTGILVVGALARDLMIRGVTGSRPDRRTADVDIAIAVASWTELDKITAGLPRGRAPHTFRVLETSVDIIPFDGVEDHTRGITWPNEHYLNVLGFREAMAAATAVRFESAVVKVATLPAQVVLKLLAWRDRHDVSSRDAVDLRTILRAYSDPPYSEIIYADEIALAATDFDLELAGAHRLGLEAMALLEAEGRRTVRAIIDAQCDASDRLAMQMGRDIRRNHAFLLALRDGMHRER